MSKATIRADLKQNYDNYYTDQEAEWRALGAIDKSDNIVAMCADIPHGSVLEIGAGEGSLLQQLAARSFSEELHALEISASGVQAIRSKNIAGLRDCQLFDGYAVPYGNDRFDLVVLSHVVEHLEHPRQLLAEAARVGRHLFVEVPLEDTLRMPSDYAADKVGHINFYSPKTIRRLLQTSELVVLAQRVMPASRAIHRYYGGFRGGVSHAIKAVTLAIAPSVAVRVFTYHSALLCRRM
jgi:2-polyprenyl-3-methyl-5-hydroxy-6-metoxy-1,4-benzoquinol methylase